MKRYVIQGKVQKCSTGRKIISCSRNLRGWFNCTSKQLFTAAVSETRLAEMQPNLATKMALEELEKIRQNLL